MEWDKDACLNLINEYRNQTVLWNSQDSNFYSRAKKETAWNEISERLGKDSEEVKKKIESLKGSYRREKARVRKSIALGKRRSEIYRSNWFAYKSLQFLDIKDKSRKSLPIGSNSQTASDDEEIGNEALEDSLGEEEDPLGEEKDPLGEESINSQTSATEQPTNETRNKKLKSLKIRLKKRKKDNEEVRVAEVPAFEYLQQPSRTSVQQQAPVTSMQQKDQCSLFGDYIADKLRTLDNRLRAVAQHRISNVLFELEMNLYEDPDVDVKM